MNAAFPHPFPNLHIDPYASKSEDRNPGILLFGRRFFPDQTGVELLAELLLVAASPKRIGKTDVPEDEIFPGIDVLRPLYRSGNELTYAPKARLNLKLFAFLTTSRLDTRHPAHLNQHKKLTQRLVRKDKLTLLRRDLDADEVASMLEDLFLGFYGAGADRTWSARTFFPVRKELLAGETLWNITEARRQKVLHWGDIVDHFNQFFAANRHRFLARGGELLYLQLCNLLSQPSEQTQRWAEDHDLGGRPENVEPETLRTRLSKGLRRTVTECPDGLGRLAEFIDCGLDPYTAAKTDFVSDGSPRFTTCAWCPAESWPEALLFALELINICEADLDPVVRLDFLGTACAMQVLRSLCAQSARHVPQSSQRKAAAGMLGYLWAVSGPDEENEVVRRLAQRSVVAIEQLIFNALRCPEIQHIIEKQKRSEGSSWKDPYAGPNGADSRYGHKLFRTVAKRLGLIVPRKGPNARFVLDEGLVRYLVAALVPPGRRMEYTTFLDRLLNWHGIVVDESGLRRAAVWAGGAPLYNVKTGADAWFQRMLEDAGMLHRLSDSCSLVRNPFGEGGKGG